MSCNMKCAVASDYKNGWEFYGPDAESLTSHHFEVGKDPIVLTVVGLLPGQCVHFEQVFGCGVGDTFVPFVPGCCPLTLCLPTTSVTIASSGRYRMVLDGDPVPDPTDVTIYGRPQLVPPGYGETSMSCCSPSHVPAVITTADGVTTVTASGTDNQSFSLKFNPLVATSLIAADAASVNLLCTALTPCIAAMIPTPLTVAAGDMAISVSSGPNYLVSFNPVPAASELVGDPSALSILCAGLSPCMQAMIPTPVTVAAGDTAVSVSTGPNYLVSFNPVPAASELVGDPSALSILCAGLSPCMQALIPAPVTVTAGDAAISVGTGPNYVTNFNPVPAASELVGDPSALSILCAGLSPCMQALIPPPSGADYPNVTSPTSTVVVGGSGTQNITVDVDPVSTAGVLVSNPTSLSVLCNGLNPCIIAAISPYVHAPVTLTNNGAPALSASLVGQHITLGLEITTLPDLLTGGVPSGALVTEELFRTALGTGQDRYISIARAGAAGMFSDTGGVNTSGVTGLKSGATQGNGVTGLKTSTGYGSGLYGEENGSGGYGVIGYVPSSTGLGAGYFLKPAGLASVAPALLVQNDDASGNGVTVFAQSAGVYAESAAYVAVQGASDAATYATAFFQNNGNGVFASLCTPSTGLLTNGHVAGYSFIVTSDTRLKTNVVAIDPDLAIRFADGVRWVEFTKASGAAPSSLPQSAERGPNANGSSVSAGRKKAPAVMQPERQFGVIAQELQKLANEVGAFHYLIRPIDAADKDSLLAVDYTSLYAVLAFAERERGRRIEARLAKLEGK